jgi:hypothetical protein
MTTTTYDDEAELLRYSGKPLQLLPQVVRQYRKSGFQIAKEIWDLGLGPGRLTPADYFLFQLYDDKRYSVQEKKRFISDRQHWKIASKCSNHAWEGLTEDKWIIYNLLERNGFRTPRTLAVIDQSIRSFGSDQKITSPAMLKDFLRELNSFPVFGKANSGIGSFGAFVIAGVDGDHVLLEQAEPMTFERLFEKVIGTRTFLLQAFVQNHSTILALSKYVATVRAINFVKSNEVSTPFMLLKIPAATSIADNYWRPGNLLADLDPMTGVIRRVVRGKGLELEELSKHPETGTPLLGLALPHWDELRAVNDACARLFAAMRYHSFDIALTVEGPLVIEANIGGNFELPQLATGSGLLTDEVRAFFESCGCKFKGR